MPVKMTSESVNDMIEQLLLTGAASTASQAEEIFLDAHLPELAQLVAELDVARGFVRGDAQRVA